MGGEKMSSGIPEHEAAAGSKRTESPHPRGSTVSFELLRRRTPFENRRQRAAVPSAMPLAALLDFTDGLSGGPGGDEVDGFRALAGLGAGLMGATARGADPRPVAAPAPPDSTVRLAADGGEVSTFYRRLGFDPAHAEQLSRRTAANRSAYPTLAGLALRLDRQAQALDRPPSRRQPARSSDEPLSDWSSAEAYAGFMLRHLLGPAPPPRPRSPQTDRAGRSALLGGAARKLTNAAVAALLRCAAAAARAARQLRTAAARMLD